jgi:hypothetical protein
MIKSRNQPNDGVRATKVVLDDRSYIVLDPTKEASQIMAKSDYIWFAREKPI